MEEKLTRLKNLYRLLSIKYICLNFKQFSKEQQPQLGADHMRTFA